MWDEFIIGGDVQETSKKNVLKAISDQDMIMEVSLETYLEYIIYFIFLDFSWFVIELNFLFSFKKYAFFYITRSLGQELRLSSFIAFILCHLLNDCFLINRKKRHRDFLKIMD